VIHQQFYEDREIDQQVNVFADREGYDAVLASLYRALKSERELLEENERYRKEESSVDHAYATLLAHGARKQAPFRLKRSYELTDGEVNMKVDIYSGPGKAAVIVKIINAHGNEPWRFKEVRLTSDLTARTARPFALRMNRAEVVPGATGTLAVVADKSAFASKEGLVDLTLEIFRDDGLQQAVVSLDHQLARE
jgi:hypothetical protein